MQNGLLAAPSLEQKTPVGPWGLSAASAPRYQGAAIRHQVDSLLSGRQRPAVTSLVAATVGLKIDAK